MKLSLSILLMACLWADGAQGQSGLSLDYDSPRRTPGDQTPCDNWPEGTPILLRVGARARMVSAVFVGQVIGSPRVESIGGALYEGDGIRFMDVSPDTNVIVQLRVLKSWKGTQIGKVVTVRTYSVAGDGVPFRRGHKYLVYASKGHPDSTRLATSLCERSRELRYAGEDVAILGTLTLNQ